MKTIKKNIIPLFIIIPLLFSSANSILIKPKNIILVPAYYGESGSEFNKLINFNKRVYDTFAILNVDDGPGNGKLDFYTTIIRRLLLKGKKPLGYVYTSYGKRNLNEVKSDIDNWFSYYKNIKGMFLDETQDTDEFVNYYKELYTYIKSKYKGTVIINPGTNFDPALINYCDYAVVFEGNLNEFRTFEVYDSLKIYSNKLVALIYGVNLREINDLETLLKNKNIVNYYLTCDNLPNPWDTFSTCLNYGE
ncbi:MAG: spherulation-specific family 4 protein [Caldisericum sp.]|uniref:spherulation-specific family 4 protein n=1 Tax=Caldisericum TaxID=693074 RepID=UPI003C750D63